MMHDAHFDKNQAAAGQARINEAEVSTGPQSYLRLWRGFIGWTLGVAFGWEIIGRPVITTYWPDAVLPPSMLDIVMRMLLGMMGLGL